MAQIFISVGTNTNREHHLRMAVQELAQLFGSLQLSTVYESAAVGFTGDAFYNMVIGARTELSVSDCVRHFKAIEDRHGRVRDGEKFCGRTLDLDLLTYDDYVCQQPLELPRAEIIENAFVLWPLAEIAGDQLHPVCLKTYQTLWSEYEKAQAIWPIEFEFEQSKQQNIYEYAQDEQ